MQSKIRKLIYTLYAHIYMCILQRSITCGLLHSAGLRHVRRPVHAVEAGTVTQVEAGYRVYRYYVHLQILKIIER
jgi:hypothetical protein